MEWSDQYNEFNSMKGLSYFENYQQILAWMDGKGPLPPPIECNLEPFAGCNVNCYFCITQRYLRTTPEEVGSMRKLTTDYMLRLVDFLAKWGVKGLCISGGGEPTLATGLWDVALSATRQGMKVSFVTNGTNMTDEIANAFLVAQWVDVSIDAATRDTYRIVKGADMFHRVISNMRLLVEKRAQTSSKMDLVFKMLVLPENYRELAAACKLAKDIGFNAIHIRPVDFERWDIPGHHKLELPMNFIKEELARCREEETKDFEVYAVTHKFDPDFHVVHQFHECLATPLLMTVLTDGNSYLCVDKKMEAPYQLGSAYPDPENILKWWGGDRHRELIKGVDIGKCSRCTFSQYNVQMEKVVKEDSMMLSFP